MRYYPVLLDIRGKRCVVFGGGKVAERKVGNLLHCGAKVKVISPRLTDRLSKMAKGRRIEYLEGEYRPGLIEGAFLVFAATSSRKANARIGREAKRLGVPVNVCDSAGESTFILPAVLRKRGLTIGVSTGGVSPARSVEVRNTLKRLIEEGCLSKGKRYQLKKRESST
ncbi:MAG: bifunctional precorrin-2 dehydrogenase/sirohydrochlorin ferrochelatase [Desulfobacterota bacterium]|nr:bifunctional precorrin-2 dehydrogenase/sirohydrochlorin ferrochelatase [Thermodesulfobacteriota bacterium]